MLLTPEVKHILPRALWLQNKNGLFPLVIITWYSLKKLLRSGNKAILLNMSPTRQGT